MISARRSTMAALPARGMVMVAGLVVATLALATAFGVTRAVAQVTAVDSIAVTVADMDRSLAFYRDVLRFEPVSDVEVSGEEWERLQGVFGLRMRIVRRSNASSSKLDDRIARGLLT